MHINQDMMKLTATMPLRNVDWCCGLTIRAALMWCDEIVLLLHACTDGTREIVEQVIREHDRGRVHVLYDSDPVWHEMPHRQRMLECARKHGATHIAIVDSDEILTGGINVRSEMNGLAGGEIFILPGFNLRGSLGRYHDNGVWGNRWFSFAFQDHPEREWSGDRFHQREPGPYALIEYRPVAHADGGLMHLWGASERRLKAKHALYKITERLRWPDKDIRAIDRMYSLAIKGGSGAYGDLTTWTYRAVPDHWWTAYLPLMKNLHVDAVPWEEAEVRRTIAQHGIEMFAGLDLFGVDRL